jgi:hypothetical protein
MTISQSAIESKVREKAFFTLEKHFKYTVCELKNDYIPPDPAPPNCASVVLRYL